VLVARLAPLHLDNHSPLLPLPPPCISQALTALPTGKGLAARLMHAQWT
jgi:hypothetical protein